MPDNIKGFQVAILEMKHSFKLQWLSLAKVRVMKLYSSKKSKDLIIHRSHVSLLLLFLLLSFVSIQTELQSLSLVTKLKFMDTFCHFTHFTLCLRRQYFSMPQKTDRHILPGVVKRNPHCTPFLSLWNGGEI